MDIFDVFDAQAYATLKRALASDPPDREGIIKGLERLAVAIDREADAGDAVGRVLSNLRDNELVVIARTLVAGRDAES